MKAVLSLIFILLFSVSAVAHPGKTDRRGGHKCWKNCGEWELGRGEYHLHDKEGKPIRLDQSGNVPEPEQAKGVPIPEKRFLLDDLSGQAAGPETGLRKNPEKISADQKSGGEKHHFLTVYEESILPLNSVLLLLAFLMLIFLIFVRTRKGRE